MPVRPHWFLPTNGDSRTDLSLGNAVGAHGARIDAASTTARPGDIGYMAQVARAAEALGFEAALTPTSSWREEAWVMTAALTQHTRAGTALVGSHEEVADRIAEYRDLGIDEFILSGYPHLEEAYRVREGLLPVLRARGLVVDRERALDPA